MTTPTAAAVDVYGLASRLLTLVVDGLSSRGVSVPLMRYVGGGALPAYDGEQVTVNVRAVTDGQPLIGQQNADPYIVMQYAALAIAIVRDNFPTDIPTAGAPLRALKAASKQQIEDMGQLRAVLIDIRADQTLVDDSTPFLIPDVTSEGPEGGVVATVCIVQIALLQPSYDEAP